MAFRHSKQLEPVSGCQRGLVTMDNHMCLREAMNSNVV